MEHFAFVPQAFTRRAVDLGNEVLYSTMDSVEKVVKERLGATSEVDKGLLRLETLLESLVDLRFDQYEAYLHRNVFTLSTDLLPYVKLDHHPDVKSLDALKGQDDVLLKAIEEERKRYQLELERSKAIDAAEERIDRRLEALVLVEQELDALGFGISSDLACESASIPHNLG